MQTIVVCPREQRGKASSIYGVDRGGSLYSIWVSHRPLSTHHPKKRAGITIVRRKTQRCGIGLSYLSSLTAVGRGKRLGLVLHHDDAKREYAVFDEAIRLAATHEIRRVVVVSDAASDRPAGMLTPLDVMDWFTAHQSKREAATPPGRPPH